jgi:hypothetical protein
MKEGRMGDVTTGAGCENIYSSWVKYQPHRERSTSFHGSWLSGWTPRHFLAIFVVVSSSRNGQPYLVRRCPGERGPLFSRLPSSQFTRQCSDYRNHSM